MTIDTELILRAKQYVDDTLTTADECLSEPKSKPKSVFFRKLDKKRPAKKESVCEKSPVRLNDSAAERMLGAPMESAPLYAGAVKAQSIVPDDVTKTLDESFSQMLLRKIDESGMTDAECYKRANVDRKLFSKIRSDRTYRPSKQTALCFIFALALPINEANEMLMKAGYALSHSIKFDVVIEFFIINGIYDLTTVNEVLYEFDLPLLGV